MKSVFILVSCNERRRHTEHPRSERLDHDSAEVVQLHVSAAAASISIGEYCVHTPCYPDPCHVLHCHVSDHDSSFFSDFFRGSHEWSTPAVTQIVSMLPTLRTLGARHMALGMTARHMSKTVGIVTEKPFAAAAVEGIEDVFNEDFRG